jgi:hypothetical protein
MSAESRSKDPTRTAWMATMPPIEISAVSDVPPPMSTTMLAIGSLIGSPAPDRRRHWLFDQLGIRSARPAGGIDHCPTLHRGDRRRHTDHHPWTVESADADAFEEQPDHLLGDFKVGDRTLTKRPNGHDVGGRSADHVPRLAPHRQHILGPAVDRDDRGFVQDDPLAARVHQGVRGAEVDGKVACQWGVLSNKQGEAVRISR